MKIFLWGIVVIKIKRNKGAQIKRKIIIKLFPLSRSFPFWWSRGAASGSPRAKRAAKPQRSNRQRGGWLWDTICFFPFEKFWSRQSGKDFSKENKAFYSKIYNVTDRAGKGGEKDPIKPVFRPKNRGWRFA